MTVEARISKDNGTLTIQIKGKFDFSLLREFRQAYSADDYRRLKTVIDLRDTVTVDSSGLGMLLNMKRHLDKGKGDISIINCNSDVRKILRIARFDKMFKMG